MDPSSAQRHHLQEMEAQTLESMLVCTKTQQLDQSQKSTKPKPQPEQSLKCPRCDSTNTKFCYYNNYSLTQPRYFCKSCRRYWTKGGTLRNVPVGGGCRKNKRSSSSSSSKRNNQDQSLTPNIPSPLSSSTTTSLPSLAYHDHYSTHDLSLAFAGLHKQGFDGAHDFSSVLGNHNLTHCGFLGNPNSLTHHHVGNVEPSSHTTSSSFLDALRGGTGFVEASNNGYQNLSYGMGINGNYMGSVENGGEMGMTYEDHDHVGCATTTAVTVTTMKQEMCNGSERGEGGVNNRVLWGFPWQNIGGEGNNMGGEVDSARESWNGIGGSSNWHGLLNSPLM